MLPPLRERFADHGTIIDALLPRLAARNRLDSIEVTDGAIAALRAHTWPGNIRELENVLERAVVLTGKRVIEAADLVIDRHRGGVAPAFAGDTANHREYLDATHHFTPTTCSELHLLAL